MHGLVTKELTHPFTDKPLVLKVMSWSPSSQAMSRELKRTIEQGVEKKEPLKPAARPQETRFQWGDDSSVAVRR